MKRKDIKAGVIYAVKNSYGPPSPIVFLEDGAATLFESQRHVSGLYRALPASDYYKAGSGNWARSSRGYAAVTGNGLCTATEVLAAMREIDPAAELARFQGPKDECRPASKALSFHLVTTLSRIGGPYDEELAAYETAEQAKRERDEKDRAARRAVRRRADDVRERLGERAGIRSDYVQNAYGKPGVWISLEDAGRLLSLLDEKTGD